jgi:PAS domain S-box-containing protein
MGTAEAGRPGGDSGVLRSCLTAILESASDAIIGAALDGTVTGWSAGAERIYGYSAAEMTGRSLSVLAPPGRDGKLTRVLALLRRGQPVEPFETRHVRRDGQMIDVSVAVSPVRGPDGNPAGIAAVARDITARNRMAAQRRADEARAREAERMETVGQLAGGIAHDFSSLLGAIVGFAGLIFEAADSPAVRADAEQILAAAQRATQLTRELLTFSRRGRTRPQLTDLNAVLGGARDLLEASVGERIGLRYQQARELPAVLADHGQLDQVLLNLAVNARDAMPHGGTLTIATGEAELPEGHAGPRPRPDVSPGRYVSLTVTDTGYGMSPDVLRRSFEPFFTTKPLGLGTGLGLSTVYGIVTQAGGAISVESEVGMGTSVHLYLPVAGTPVQARPPSAPGPRGHGESILVVDDEPGVLAVTARILRLGGYQAAEAPTSAEALSLLAAGDFELLLADSVMPGMAGPELAARAVEIRPGLRVLHTSGSSRDVVPGGPAARAGMTCLQKPFTARALLEQVREVLDRGSGQ